jgi:hypothetical protein
MILFDSLSVATLAELLVMSTRMTSIALNALSSVLNIPEQQNSLLRLFHPSFRDFLLDKQGCSDDRFWIDETQVHDDVAEHSIDVMSNTLRRNICHLPTPGTLSNEVESSKVDQYLPVHVQYACQYWIDPVQRGHAAVQDEGKVHEFLRNHILHWLEALSLMRKLFKGLLKLKTLESVLTVSYPTNCTTSFILILPKLSLKSNLVCSPSYMTQTGSF